ncbi:hypothetical protein ZEAMMB73_Zm00001d006240 [Zea mays]|uniref:Uncharacterized protein n=1 Tax=Zea mays TaxID=4577 RepID=A0A1D6EU16_MAIZE|nr:hypothetical protein ZEAMMB73_Zm00001d013851 [Zea mays]ONM23164.1 hypothetical protein ZEAMMB73_Zm00001d006240 [Zea mays]
MKLGCHLTRPTNQFLEQLQRLSLRKSRQQLLVMAAPRKKLLRGLHRLKISLRLQNKNTKRKSSMRG